MKFGGLVNVPNRSFGLGSGQFFENFQQGIAPYTLGAGTPGLLSVADNILTCAAHNGPVSDYSRFMDANSPSTLNRMSATSISLDLRITADNPDDAAFIFVMNNFGLQPRREAVFDSLRRPIVTFNGVNTTLGTVGLTIGVWYRFLIRFVAGVNQTRYRIAERDSGVLFLEGTLTAPDFPGANIGRSMGFSFDTGGLTCPTQYARIVCQ